MPINESFHPQVTCPGSSCASATGRCTGIPRASVSIVGVSTGTAASSKSEITKGGTLRPSPPEWARDGRPEHLRAACEGSLRRLREASIDELRRVAGISESLATTIHDVVGAVST